MYKHTFLFLLLIPFLLIVSCSKEEDEIPGAEPLAVAEGPQTALVNSTVQFNGSNSTDPDGDPLTFSWSVTASPQGSSASLDNPSQAITTFIPDLPGSYTITLAVSDGNWDPVEDQVFLEVVEAIGNPPVPVIFDDDQDLISADNNNNETTIGVPYVLDGSFSTDPDNDAITFSWEVIESPQGSDPQINDPQAEIVEFVADVTGEYIIGLTLEDQNGNVASTQVTLLATANPVVWNESISVDTTFPNVFEDPALPDYLLTVSAIITAELTIEPGVVIQVEPGNKITVSSISGALIALGKADSMIVFTAEDQTNGWPGILIISNNQNNQLDHVQISYAGAAALGSGVPEAALGVESGDIVNISNSQIDHSFGYGMYVESGGLIGSFENNDFNNNGFYPLALPADQVGQLDQNSVFAQNNTDAVEVLGTTLRLNDEITWSSLTGQVPYYVSGDLYLQSGLVLDAGASVEMKNTASIVVSNDGYLSAIGTETDSIWITAHDKTNGWPGIAIFNNQANNIFDYVSLSYGGNEGLGSGLETSIIGIENGDKAAISNSTISNSLGEYGLYVESGGTLGSIEGNLFKNNSQFPIGVPTNQAHQLKADNEFQDNGSQHVEIHGGVLNESQEVSWVKFTDGTPFYISDRVDLQSGLKILPGATLKFASAEAIRVLTEGYLNAVGTADEMITFTAMDQANPWNGIGFYTNFNSNELNYCVVSYAGANGIGSGLDPANVGIESGDKATIQNCEISNSAGDGIFVESGGTINDGATVDQVLNDFGNTFDQNAGTDVVIE
ncbi:MAG: PKD domain-containing protein [Candidatus Cyclobacteriaceae bacterium M3_2C_046]